MEHIPHAWDLEPSDAILLQKKLAGHLDTETPIDLDGLELVGGVDVSVKDNISRAAVVVLTFPEFEPVDSAVARMPTPFPYIPGLLTFREGEVILDAWQQLATRPDAYIFDGAGIAHPRRMGIAAHIGLWFDAPTVGCAKSRLTGRFDGPGTEKGSCSPLLDDGQQIGVVLRTRTDVKPVFVSPGHHATIDSARELVLRCCPKYKLPEPVRAAHKLAGEW